MRVDPYAYNESKVIAVKDYSFYGLLMAVMRKTDTENAEKLKVLFPSTWEYLAHCYNCPGCVTCGRGQDQK